MSYFKDTENKLHFLDDDSFAESLLPIGSVKITNKAAKAIIDAMNTPSEMDKTLAEIHSLEASITPRRIREAVLGIDNGWLKETNDKISELRASL